MVKPGKKSGNAVIEKDFDKSRKKSVPKKSTIKPTKSSRLLILNSPLYAFLSPLRAVQNQWTIKYVVILFAVIIRAAISRGPYSGMNTPPMFGDFEAQRHWLDLTVNLPISEWYYYNLQYWGLDYPPLTAYHSLILGYIGKTFINLEWFQLDLTNGLENNDLKTFMRITVIVSELLTYIPGVYYFTKWFNKHIDVADKKSILNQTLTFAIILFIPTLILIDHGHFQYNCVMLGFVLLSIDCFLNDYLMLGSIFFVFSLTFKQMALFYAPLVFAYLLGSTFNPFNKLFTNRNNKYDFLSLFLIGSSTIFAFFISFGPLFIFSHHGLDNLLQSIHRIFPFNRGIFEDKVANFWCATNTVIKYKNFSLDFMKMAALSSTLLSVLPSCGIIYFVPSKVLLPWALASCSWGFFLFSFQVHEKSVLLPLLPTNLLLCYINDNDMFKILSWINNISLFSLGPLLKKDGVHLQYYSMAILSNWLVGNLAYESLVSNILALFKNWFTFAWLTNWFIFGTTVLSIVLDFIPYFVDPPSSLPDIWVVANITLSFLCFMFFYLYITWKTFKISQSC